MIQANELRIGNWVTQINKVPIQVLSIESDYNYGEQGKSFYIENGNDYEIAISDMIPIPLTPEILTEWCGFEYKRTDKSDTYKLGDFRANFVLEGRFKGNRYMVYGNVLTFKDFSGCKYLHQFQNLYFALTGTELEINKK